MKPKNTLPEERTYYFSTSCRFRKTKEQYGGLSNMAGGFPIKINDLTIHSSEALYQACRFPHLPEVQERILNEKSAMTAKMVSKPLRDESRKDWLDLRIKIMRWCLKVKLAQNFDSFGRLIESTIGRDIVEESSKDAFWGAIPFGDNQLKGTNALGRLLMELRSVYCSENRYDLLVVQPLAIPTFVLLGKKIKKIDERRNYVKFLNEKMGLKKGKKTTSHSLNEVPQKREKGEELLLF